MATVLSPAEHTVGDVRSLAQLMLARVRDGSIGRMAVPRREVVEDASGRKFLSMPAVSADLGLYINKTATIVAREGQGSTVTSVVSVFSAVSGDLLAIVDGAAVTNLKCAAVTALVTDRCAAPGAAVLGIVGSGVQARQQFLGVSAVRDLRVVRVHSRDTANARAFGDWVCEVARRDVEVVVCDSVAAATSGVDIVATTTTSVDPLPISPDLPDHVHMNCMGGHTTDTREVSLALLASSSLVVEDIGTAVAEAGPVHAGALDLVALQSHDHTVLQGKRTIFSSTGHASLDLITCAHLIGDHERPTSG